MDLDDLSIVAQPDAMPPAKLVKALAVVGRHLHPACDTIFSGEISKRSCVLVSLILRDFLYGLGFTDAEVRSVCYVMEVRRDDEPLHQLVIGMPGKKDSPKHWSGHLVTVLPKVGWLIDATLYQAQRPAHWPGMPGMVALPLQPTGDRVARFAAKGVDDAIITGQWWSTPKNTRWRTAPDALRGGNRERQRRAIADRLLEAFGNWED